MTESYKTKIDQLNERTPKQLSNPTPQPKNSQLGNPNPKNSPLGPQNVKNDPKIKSKSTVRIEGNIESESCSTT